MTAISNTPINRNFQSPLDFEFRVKKLPHVNFFLQKVNFPSLELPPVPSTNPFTNIPYAGDHIKFGPLSIEFKVDEDFQNYIELFRWMQALGFPEKHEQYKQLAIIPLYTGDGLVSDVSVMSLTSTKLANYEIVCIDAHPIALSELKFDTTNENVDFISATATFTYTLFDIQEVI